MKLKFFAPFLALFVMSAHAGEQLVYFGTYTKKGPSEGIYVATFDDETGKVGTPELAAKISNPSFVAIHPSKKFLFACSENADFEGEKAGSVTSFKIDEATGKLTALNTLSTEGAHPCHLSTDSGGRCLMVANYTGGNTKSYQIADDGTISAVSNIQHEGEKPRAHSANPGPNDKFAFVADLGLDKVLIYKLDAAAGKISEHGFGSTAKGSGPRHFDFHPNGKWAYVINERTLTATGFTFDHEAGTLTEFQTLSTIPEADRANLKGLSTAEIQVHPSGRFVYGSNRGHDTIAVFKVAPDSGKLSLIENALIEGKTPRNFGIDETGKWMLVAGQNSDSVAVFSINEDTGKLKFTGQKFEVGAPVCVRFLAR